MKFVKSFLIVAALLASSFSHADQLPIYPNQERDRQSCPTFRRIWNEKDVVIPGVGTYQFGPGVDLPPGFVYPNPFTDEFNTAAQTATYWWFFFAGANARYNQGIIGYDQLEAAFNIASDRLLPAPDSTGYRGQETRGVVLPMPSPVNFPGLSTNPEQMRRYKVANFVWITSALHQWDADQLSRITMILNQTPTCNGLPY